MSLHVVNPELEAQLAAQRRNSTIASIIVGILLMTLLALVFYFIGINIFSQKTEPIVSYADEAVDQEQLQKVKITNQVKKTPSSPSSSSVKIMTAMATSDFSLPTPEVATESMSIDFGESEGFGDGWGAGSGFGSGGGSGAFSFMGSKMSGERVCFVIDYSLSMGGKRIKLLKAELEKTIEALPNGVEYQMIFFAGPAWIAGSKVEMQAGNKIAKISLKGKNFKWKGKGAFNWSHEGREQPVEWLKQSSSVKKKSLESIRETPLIWGTSWTAPLEMAINMSPKPELIVFLTDGSSGGESFKKAEELGRKAKEKRIKVNTIALMEPKARDAMAELADIAGGEFSLIGADGKKVRQVSGKKVGFKKAK